MRCKKVSLAVLLVPLMALILACAQRQLPPGYQPELTLLDRVESINIKTPPFACPGQNLPAAYEARLDDGTILPFATEYDDDNPPPLHISFLSRSSPEAEPLEDGSWDIASDPLSGATTGYRLNALLMHKPTVHAQLVVDPDYSCLPHAFEFQGEQGQDGPRVTVRVDILSSPFFERLFLAEILPSGSDPLYVLADADRLPRTGWLTIESKGGTGVQGRPGRRGRPGRSGSPGCPGGRGESGGMGGPGGRGGPGGSGGEIFLMVPTGETGLAWLVQARSPGGVGGPGGLGGAGGRGGSGGSASGEGCSSGSSGSDGLQGGTGRRGVMGSDGPALQIIEFPRERVFRQNGPAALWVLIEQARTTGGGGSGVQQ
jgi:hypothetical protein